MIALSKLYSLNDPRLAQTQVKGDLIPNSATEGRIMTRSRAKQSSSSSSRHIPWCIPEDELESYTGLSPQTDPDTYTVIPATLKILKVLIEELLSASGAQGAANAAAAAVAEFGGGGADGASDGGDDDDDGWEDEPGGGDTLDLSLGGVRADLMSYMDNANLRQRDDETQAYLTEFFVAAARENVAGFQGWYELLTEEEKGKLQELAAAR